MAEWIATSAGSGDFNALLGVEKATNTRHLLSLHHDLFMFHQANLRQTDVTTITLPNGSTGQYSLFQAWIETVVTEMIRLYVNLNVLFLAASCLHAGHGMLIIRIPSQGYLAHHLAQAR